MHSLSANKTLDCVMRILEFLSLNSFRNLFNFVVFLLTAIALDALVYLFHYAKLFLTA